MKNLYFCRVIILFCFCFAVPVTHSFPAVAKPSISARSTPSTLPIKSQNSRSRFRAIARREAKRQGVPFALVDAVMFIESRYRHTARGRAGEVGLMQIMPPTARLLGFKGTKKELADPKTNIQLGTSYLASAWQKGGKDVCTAVMKYRAGHAEKRFSVRSVEYCKKVRQRLRLAGYPVTGKVPKATFGFSGAKARRQGSKSSCYARVVQPGPRYGQCIPLSLLVKLGLVIKARK